MDTIALSISIAADTLLSCVQLFALHRIHQRLMSRAKHWTFTLNNWTALEQTALRSLVNDPQVNFVIWGRETADSGTPHLQGFISFDQRRRPNQVKALIGQRAHIEIARNIPAAIQYCKKDNDFEEHGAIPQAQGSRNDLEEFKTAVKGGMVDMDDIREHHSEIYAKYTRFVIEYVDQHLPTRALTAHPLREWQQALNARLESDPDDRTIEFIVDVTGNSGKTWFAHYFASIHDGVQVIQPGRKADMAFALKPTIRVLFIDAPRSKQGEFIQYDFLEDVKNGYVFSTKYESRVKQLSKCHVVVMMNELPDLTKLSQDRYKITQL